jgi:hypothetical protein
MDFAPWEWSWRNTIESPIRPNPRALRDFGHSFGHRIIATLTVASHVRRGAVRRGVDQVRMSAEWLDVIDL